MKNPLKRRLPILRRIVQKEAFVLGGDIGLVWQGDEVRG